MPGRIEKTVFISYRRTNLPWALAIFQNLKNEGYDVFFDYLSIPSGDFENIIIENIKARAHFVVILTPSALERCNEPGDWLRREIETAMDEKRNIVPLMLESFDFGSPSTVNALTGKLEKLKKYNGLRLHSEYFFEGMNRLREQYLNISLDAIVHPVSGSTIAITEEHQAAASEAAPVEKEQLSAQEWFERGGVFYENQNYEEGLRCYTETIKLDPKYAFAYFIRGYIWEKVGELDKAIDDYDGAIQYGKDQLDSATFYSFRGDAFRKKNDLNDAIADLNKAIQIDPSYNYAYSARGRLKAMLGDLDGAISDYSELIRITPDHVNAHCYRASILELKEDFSSAIADYEKYLELGGGGQNGDQIEIEAKIKKLKSKLAKKKTSRTKAK